MLLVKLAIILFSLLLCNPTPGTCETTIKPPLLIAHAGGIINERSYTNSLEALNHNYGKGHRFFEVDFSWTTDGELVAIHDWESTFRAQFIVPPNIDKIPSKAQFINVKSKMGLTQLSLDDVFAWVLQKDKTYIVTDIKEDNLKALTKIASNTYYKKVVIPQIYSFDEYEDVLKLGFENIILTIYKMKKIIRSDVVEFAVKKKPFAVTMPLSFAQSGLASSLKDRDIVVYAHTINDPNLFESLKTNGVYGVYTDRLTDSAER